MKREEIDLHSVRPEHIRIHDDLLNWERVVRVHVSSGGDCGPMFKHYRTSSYSVDEHRIWHADEPKRPPPRMQEGWAMEKRMRNLPAKEKAAIKWHYIEPFKAPAKVAHKLAVTVTVLGQLVHNGRTMLKNRC